jgi:tripartite-type tricarboxylate transporter receptor subunit TctC
MQAPRRKKIKIKEIALMFTVFKKINLTLTVIAVVGAFGSSATAQTAAGAYPSRPVTLIVPWPPGGSTDRHLRVLAEAASKHLGQPILVVNQPGAGGTLGPGNMSQVAKPDGYTVAQFPMGMLRIPHMQKVAWDPIKDFTPIIGVTGYTFGLVVRADSPFKTFRDYLEAAKLKPNNVNYGSTGIGTSPHLLMEEVADKAKVTLNHVPFKGNADLVQGLMGGHVQAQSDATGWAPYVNDGRMRLLVTFGEKRTKRWNTVPNASELGLDVVSTSPYGLVGPKGMDPAVVKVLHDAFKKGMEEPEHVKVLDILDQEPWYKNTDEYAKWLRETFPKEKGLIDRLGLSPK